MTDMIERVARAIMEAREGSGKGSCQVKDWKSEYRENPHVKQAVDQAIAAIKAIREPSEGMKAVVAGDWGRRTWDQYGQVIDAALKGTEQ